MQKLNEIGYFSLDRRPDLAGATFRQVMASLIGLDDTAELESALALALNVAHNSSVMMAIEWLGLLSDEAVPGETTLLDVLAVQMLARMAYRPEERDMVVLVHEFTARYTDRTERITSTLLDLGVPGGETSMARTVGLPAAIGVRLILDGEISLTGVHVPVVPEIYEPALERLSRLGIAFEEQVAVSDL
jgi:saccharopine dehydrogenase-like NADP-dependent oxidoreductase